MTKNEYESEIQVIKGEKIDPISYDAILETGGEYGYSCKIILPNDQELRIYIPRKTGSVVSVGLTKYEET